MCDEQLEVPYSNGNLRSERNVNCLNFKVVLQEYKGLTKEFMTIFQWILTTENDTKTKAGDRENLQCNEVLQIG